MGASRIKVIDSHTGGEPTRVVVAGGPDLGSGTMAERAVRFREQFDGFRSATVNEPRGNDAIVGALLCEPNDPAFDAGVIFYNNVGYLGMCGHGTIGLVVTLAHMGRVQPGSLVRLETTVGNVEARLNDNGSVTIRNVASYRSATHVAVDAPGIGTVHGDIAWGGNWFFLCSDHGQALSLDRVDELTDFSWRVRQGIEAAGITGDAGGLIDHIELFGPPTAAGADSKSFVLCPGKAYDRSPCGTGTSAKLACLYADGKLQPGQTWRQESITGSVFEGAISLADGKLYPEITGHAYVNAEADLLLDEHDPFCFGSAHMGNRFDVAIAGGGIVGAACAEECAASGLSVVVVEPGPVGGGATAAGMGHIVVMDDSPAQIALTNYSRTLWMARARELPADVEYVAAGTLWVAADEEEMAEVRRKLGVYHSIGVRASVVDARELAEAEPHLRPGLAGGLLVPDDAVVYPPCAARYQLERAQQNGAVLRIGERAAELSGQGIKLRDGSSISSGITVNATGAWAPELTPGIEVRKRKGHLVITDRYPGWVRHQLVELGYLKSAHSTTEDSVAFNVQPRKTGQVLIGSSRQFGAEHGAIDHHMLARMLARAQEYMPGLAELSAIRSWTGFRAATPDKLPLIGPCPGDERLYLATGHEGLGITTSMATGKLVADLILGRTPAIPAAPYLPGRKQEAHG